MQGKNYTPSSPREALVRHEELDRLPDSSGISFPVVAIGGQDGGMQAICNLRDHLPPALDMAFSILLYTSAEEANISIRDELQKRTVMKVVEAAHNMPLEMNKVYILPMEDYLSIGPFRFVQLSLY